jgi:hypothetical protein
VGSLTFHSPIGLQGLLRGYLYFLFLLTEICYIYVFFDKNRYTLLTLQSLRKETVWEGGRERAFWGGWKKLFKSPVLVVPRQCSLALLLEARVRRSEGLLPFLS